MPTTALSRVLLASPPAPVVPIPDPGDFVPLGLGPWAEAEAQEVSGLIIMMIIAIIITNWRRCRCRHPFPDRSEGFLSPAAEARQVRLVLFYLFILFFVFNCNCNCGINCKVWIECCLLRVLGACLTVYLIVYLLLGVMVQYCTNLELINCWRIRGWLFFFFTAWNHIADLVSELILCTVKTYASGPFNYDLWTREPRVSQLND